MKMRPLAFQRGPGVTRGRDPVPVHVHEEALVPAVVELDHCAVDDLAGEANIELGEPVEIAPVGNAKDKEVARLVERSAYTRDTSLSFWAMNSRGSNVV